MPAATHVDATLKLTITPATGSPVEAGCQVINASFTQPSNGDPTLVPVGCGGDPVAEPGDPQNGSIEGEVYKDNSATGITRLLAVAVANPADAITYIYTENLGTPQELSFTGTCAVQPFAIDFAPSKFGRHPLALSVVSATLAPAFTG